MEMFDRAPRFTFRTKTLAEEFLKRMREYCYKYDVVTVNDILKDRGEAAVTGGFNYGYAREEVRKLKPKSVERQWSVEFPIPSRMIRGRNSHWTTESVQALEKISDEEFLDIVNGGPTCPTRKPDSPEVVAKKKETLEKLNQQHLKE